MTDTGIGPPLDGGGPISVSVWLPVAVYERLRAVAAGQGLPVLARAAAAAGVEAPGARVVMVSADEGAVAVLREVGLGLNRVVAVLNENLDRPGVTVAQHRAVAARVAAALVEVGQVAAGVWLSPPGGRRPVQGPAPVGDGGRRWQMVRVTTDPVTAARWQTAAGMAGFGSVANWVRDCLTGMYELGIGRPPTPGTIAARAVVGRVLGLVAQVQLAGDEVAVVDRVCGGQAEAAGTALAAALESLVVYGGDIKARR